MGGNWRGKRDAMLTVARSRLWFGMGKVFSGKPWKLLISRNSAGQE